MSSSSFTSRWASRIGVRLAAAVVAFGCCSAIAPRAYADEVPPNWNAQWAWDKLDYNAYGYVYGDFATSDYYVEQPQEL